MIPQFAFGLLYLLIELFYIGMPVVRVDGCLVGVWSSDYQIFWDIYSFLPVVLHSAGALLLDGCCVT